MSDFVLEKLIKQFLSKNGFSFEKSLIEPFPVKIDPPVDFSYGDIGINTNIDEYIESHPDLYNSVYGKHFYFTDINQGATSSIYGKIDFKNDTLVLISKEIDLPVYCTLVLAGSNNNFMTSKTAFANLQAIKYQFFTDHLKLTINNVGVGSFVPFNLEFLRITPKKA
jgi:hypothetical protein